jgi:hypothetical protein
MWRAEPSEDDAELGVGDDQVGRSSQGGLDEGPAFVLDAFVVWRDKPDEITLGLVDF